MVRPDVYDIAARYALDLRLVIRTESEKQPGKRMYKKAIEKFRKAHVGYLAQFLFAQELFAFEKLLVHRISMNSSQYNRYADWWVVGCTDYCLKQLYKGDLF